MTPNRPYLIRAFYDWILDNNLTPYLLVNATADGVQVPPQYVKDGQIVLNLAPHAIAGLELGLDAVRFSARFGGVAQQIYIPCWAVQAIYARENGAGTMFADDEYELDSADNEELTTTVDTVEPVASQPSRPALASVDSDAPAQERPPSVRRERPHLTLVK